MNRETDNEYNHSYDAAPSTDERAVFEIAFLWKDTARPWEIWIEELDVDTIESTINSIIMQMREDARPAHYFYRRHEGNKTRGTIKF